MEHPKLQLNFKGNRAELHKRLKVWCAETNNGMTQTIMSLIEQHLKKSNKKI